jgi:hypothetical protein
VAVKKVAEPFKLGDWVRIPHFGNQRARIVELWGALGQGGKQMYRVRVWRKPKSKGKPIYIDLNEDHIVPVPAEA